MRTWVALVYSIVLGPGRRVGMADLRAVAAGLGFARPRTLLASGNLIFEAEGPDVRAVHGGFLPVMASTREAAFRATAGRAVSASRGRGRRG